MSETFKKWIRICVNAAIIAPTNIEFRWRNLVYTLDNKNMVGLLMAEEVNVS